MGPTLALDLLGSLRSSWQIWLAVAIVAAAAALMRRHYANRRERQRGEAAEEAATGQAPALHVRWSSPALPATPAGVAPSR